NAFRCRDVRLRFYSAQGHEEIISLFKYLNNLAQFLSLKKAIRKDLHFTKSARRDLAVARHLVACYLSSRAGLKQLGILRTERTLQGDFAEWLVGHLLDIRLSPSTVEKHIDGVDRAGRTYQIKSRVVSSMSQS